MLKQKGRWKKWFGGKPDYWYVIQKQRATNKPHWISILGIVVGILSPTVGICALLISLRSLQISERSLEIGQRAYVSVSKGSIRLYSGIENPNATDSSVSLVITATLSDSGNTPAKFTHFDMFYEAPKEWRQRKEFLLYKDMPADLGPKSTADWRISYSFELPQTASQEFSKRFGLLPPIPSEGLIVVPFLTYRDVFGKEVTLKWCMIQSVNTQSTFDCSGLHFGQITSAMRHAD